MRILLKLAFLSLLLPMVACNAQTGTSAAEGANFPYSDGVDFLTLARPVATEDPGKIELAEVFWYGCIHCFNLEPYLNAFVATLPEDVNVVKVPAMWAPVMELHAKLYYASKALGINDQMHEAVFKAMNEDRNPLGDERAILALVKKLGQDETAFQRAFNSFGVNSQITQAKAKAMAYGIKGTPEIIVNGKYRISTSMTGTQDKMLEVAAALIQRERAMLQSPQ